MNPLFIYHLYRYHAVLAIGGRVYGLYPSVRLSDYHVPVPNWGKKVLKSQKLKRMWPVSRATMVVWGRRCPRVLQLRRVSPYFDPWVTVASKMLVFVTWSTKLLTSALARIDVESDYVERGLQRNCCSVRHSWSLLVFNKTC